MKNLAEKLYDIAADMDAADYEETIGNRRSFHSSNTSLYDTFIIPCSMAYFNNSLSCILFRRSRDIPIAGQRLRLPPSVFNDSSKIF